MNDKTYFTVVVPLDHNARKMAGDARLRQPLRSMIWSQAAEQLKPLLGKICSSFSPAVAPFGKPMCLPFGVALGAADPQLFLMCYLHAREQQEKEIEELKETVRRVAKELLGGTGNKGECKMDMSLKSLKKMAEFVEEKANEIGVPMVFSAVDEGGNLVYYQRMEGSLLVSIKVSQDKAYTACALKCPTSDLADLTKPGDSLWSLDSSGDGRIICFGGGYPIKVDGKVIGRTADKYITNNQIANIKARGGHV